MKNVVRLLVLLALAGIAAIGWYYSGQILGPDAPPALDEQALFAVTDSSITLGLDPDARSTGVSMVEWAGGYGELGERLGGDSTRATRRFRLLEGARPRGPRVSARPFAFAATPHGMLGLEAADVSVPAPLGPCPAWRIDPAVAAGDSAPPADWVIYVHGRGANRAQSLGIAARLLDLGWTVLAITYRGDPGAPANHPPGYRLGATEWRDLEAAVRFAFAQRARRIVIFGMSMGGTIALEFARQSKLAPKVAGTIVEAPVLRWRPVFDGAARERGVPAFFTALGMAIAGWRAGIDWNELDLIARSGQLWGPILVIHGTADPVVPIALSDSLEARRRDIVTLVRVMDAGHSRCRNVDPDAYDAVIASWLGRLP